MIAARYQDRRVWPWWGFVAFAAVLVLALATTGPAFTLFSLAAFVSLRLHTARRQPGLLHPRPIVPAKRKRKRRRKSRKVDKCSCRP